MARSQNIFGWLESKIVGESYNLPLLSYTLFKSDYLLITGTDLPYVENFNNHRTIASQWYSKRIFIIKIVMFLIFVDSSIDVILSLLSIFLLSLHIYPNIILIIIIIDILFIPIILGFYRFFLEYHRKKYIYSIIVDCMIMIIVGVCRLNRDRTHSAIDRLEKSQREKHLHILRDPSIDQVVKQNKKIDKKEVSSPINDDLYTKREILSNIEDIAKYMEYYMPNQLKSRDRVTDKWFKHSMKQVAAALRDKKKWILTPMEDTYDNLTNLMLTNLILIVTGNWHALERIEYDELGHKNFIQAYSSLLIKLLKAFFIGVFPLLFLVILQKTSFAITGSTYNYAISLSFVWLGITILIGIDSSINEKISLIKDLRGLFSSKEKGP